MSEDAIIEKATKCARKFLASDVMRSDLQSAPPTEDDLLSMGEQLMQSDPTEDTNTFDAMRLVGSHMLKRGEKLPPWLEDFMARVATGEIERPTKRGPDKYLNFERDYKLARCVEKIAERYDLPKYYGHETPRKKADRPKKVTAAEVVSRASRCSVETVITAYKRHRRKHEN